MNPIFSFLFASSGDLLLVPFLFAAASLGHMVLTLASHNWWYGGAHGRRLTDLLQLTHGLLFLAGPIVFWLVFGFELQPLYSQPWGAPARAALSSYVYFCWFIGLIHFPAVTLARFLRRPPAVLESNHTETMDVAKELGHVPLGRGRWRFLARLPGNQVFQVDFAERTLRLRRLPRAWDGLTILHLTDFHFCGTPDRDFYRTIVDRCAAWEPDLVAFTGDLVDTDDHYRWIVPLLGRLRWKENAFAILGNHDFYYEPALLRRRLSRIGMRVLGNGWTQVLLRGEPLVAIGHEGPWFASPPNLTDCPRGPFRLCLSHTPDNLPWARQQDVDLMLSGHVHGGQVQLPVIGPLIVPSRRGRRYACGTFHEAPTVLHVGRGLGAEQPLRYNCRPEVTKLILRCEHVS